MSAINLLGNYALAHSATNNSTSTVGEPSVGFADRNIFITGNWYASRSTDLGASWAHIDPFTTLPSASGGFCCDQVVLHDHARGVWIWILQYKEEGGANVFRLAATRDADFPNGGWYYWDIGPTTVDPDWTNLWFDYPDAALTEENLFLTFNVFNPDDNWQRAVVMRFPLDTIADAGTLVFDSWSTTEHGSLRLTQGGGSIMYWASHNSRQVRLFRWIDGQGTINWWDIDVRQWSGDISSSAPNGVDWLSRTDDRITGASVGNGRICLMWTAGSEGDDRPHPYCRVVYIDETEMRVVEEPDIWSKDRAWAYPAACTNRSGVIGFTAFYGGEDRDPGHIVGARDDAAGSWTSIYSKLGTHSPAEEKWGDYLTCRAHAPADDSWVAVGYTLEGGETRADIMPRVVHFALT